MKKFKLLLLDANVVIELFRLGIWDDVVERCDVHLARTVAEDEAHFFEDDDKQRHDFDLQPYIKANKITVFDVTVSEATVFRDRFDPVYFEKLDPGETESLVHLLGLAGECRICSADKIVYRIIGGLDRSEQGVSLEEILQKTGLGRSLRAQFTKDFRVKWTRKGFEEHMRGLGLKPPKNT
ncbi:MAG: hypothetical protein NTY65_09440 [Planctomycetota bacterium]|nr:hypothetical protein [Planctomycetota bacterium]